MQARFFCVRRCVNIVNLKKQAKTKENKKFMQEKQNETLSTNAQMRKMRAERKRKHVYNAGLQANAEPTQTVIEPENMQNRMDDVVETENTNRNQPNKQNNAHGKKETRTQGKLKVMFLGGVGEIGKNITALEYEDDIMLIDCGLAFPSEEMPGIDLVIPDFTYLKENKDRIRGIVFTHGHEDHIGSLPYLLKDVKVPLYGSKMTLTLIGNKIREHHITGIKGVVVKPRNVVSLGKFKVEFVRVNHSIAGSMALAITTPVGVVFHTGDFKIDFTPIDGEMIDLPRIAEIGRQGVLLMMGESTNVERPGYTESESVIGARLDTIFQSNADKRLIVATFASNIYRIQQIIELAIKYNRKVAVVGRSMINNIDAGQRIGEFKFPEETFVDIEKVGHMEDKNVLILSTGSQGEPMSALSRLARGEFNKIVVGENDTVIFSSSPIPGNENSVNAVINNLYRRGAIVIHENVHTSGHACREELKTIHSLIHPKFFIPVHGEYRHLKEHTLLAQNLGMDPHNMLIPEIGMCVEVTNKYIMEKGRVPAGEMLVDGLGIGEATSVVLRERKLLSEDGLIIIVVGISSTSGEVVNEPYVISRGFVYQDEMEKLNNESKQILLDTLKLMDLKEVKDWNEVRNSIRKPLRNFFFKKFKRTPMILPIIYRV